jgi:hypothetical protein
MRATRALASCAVATLATVFSVQQGGNGQALLYRQDGPNAAWVAIPAATSQEAPVTLDFSSAESAATKDGTGEWMNIRAIINDLAWRRDTAKKLRQLPFSPRF